jgi:hypothetical protein
LAGASAAESELEALKAAAQLRIATGQLAAQFQPAALTSGNRRAVVASDAMPLTWSQVALSASTGPDPDAWPLPAEAFTHPRTLGTFGRALRLLTRDGRPLELAEALTKLQPGPGAAA